MIRQPFLRLGLFLFWASSSLGATHPVNVSLVPDVALHGRTARIEGFTLSLWGENEQKSFALGFVNGSLGNSAGFSLGVLLNYSDTYTGLQIAPVNWSKKAFVGVQAALVNFAEGSVTGVQWGFFNYASHVKGLQLGFANYADTGANLIQIGLINIIAQTKDWFGHFPKALAPFMVIANWRFE